MSDILNDPVFQQFHTRAIPLGSRDNVDWSECGLAKVKTKPHGNRAKPPGTGAKQK